MFLKYNAIIELIARIKPVFFISNLKLFNCNTKIIKYIFNEVQYVLSINKELMIIFILSYKYY